MQRLCLGLFCLLSLLCLNGCLVTYSEFKKHTKKHRRLKAEFVVLREQYTSLLKTLKVSRSRLNQIKVFLKRFSKEGRVNFAEIESKLTELRQGHQQLLGRLQEIENNLKRFEQEHQAMYKAFTWMFGDPMVIAGSKDSTKSNPDAKFKAAMLIYKKQHYVIAKKMLQEFVRQHPTHPKADQAHLLLGDCLFNLGRYNQAATTYNHMRKTYPKSTLIDFALLKMGISFFKVRDCEGGKAYLKALLKRYPNTKYKSKARYLLRTWRRQCR
ncbi:MAG: tetratricopeptide repeat protein [Myxococcota bacterium]